MISQGRVEDCLAYGQVVLDIWLLTMGGLVLGKEIVPSRTFGQLMSEITSNLKNAVENIHWVHLQDVESMFEVQCANHISLIAFDELYMI